VNVYVCVCVCVNVHVMRRLARRRRVQHLTSLLCFFLFAVINLVRSSSLCGRFEQIFGSSKTSDMQEIHVESPGMTGIGRWCSSREREALGV
jgi:hypothetical protein